MSKKKTEVLTAEADLETNATGSVSDATRARIEEWAAGYDLTAEQVNDLIGKVSGWCSDEIDDFCAGFAESSATLAVIMMTVVGLHAAMMEQCETEEEKEKWAVRLAAPTIKQISELAQTVLDHVDAENVSVELHEAIN